MIIKINGKEIEMTQAQIQKHIDDQALYIDRISIETSNYKNLTKRFGGKLKNYQDEIVKIKKVK